MTAQIYPWAHLRDRFPITKPKTYLTVVRHGQTTFNLSGLVSGSNPHISLCDLGKQQARRLASYGPYDLAISSALPRAIATLNIAIAAGLEVASVTTDSRLNERCLGVLEGKPHKFIKEFRDGNMLYSPIGGESYLSVTQRVLSFLLDLEGGGRVLLVTHADVMRVLRGVIRNIAEPAEMMGHTFFNACGEDAVLKEINFPRFLPEVGS
jgi:2,3-bisphosphoglycerate-dependent phosphoglycerate mutase